MSARAGRGDPDPATRRAAPTVAVVVHNAVSHDARVLKETASLKAAGYDVRLFGLTEGASEDFVLPDGTPVHLERRDLSGAHRRREAENLPATKESSIWTSFRVQGDLLFESVATRFDPEVVHLHDHLALTAAARYRDELGCAVVWDAHEIYEDLASIDGPRAAVNARIIAENAAHVDAFITLNASIAGFYRERHPRLPPAVLVPNSVDRPPAVDDDGRLHRAAGLHPDQKVLLFQGGFSRHRGIPALLAASRRLRSDWSLVFMGWGALEAEIGREVAETDDRPMGRHRVSIIPGAPHDELLQWTAGAALGTIPYENTGLNHLYCSPNKLWEYPAAGVPILASDLPEMRRTIDAHGIGVTVDRRLGPDDIAAVVNGLTDDDLDRMRRRCAAFTAAETWQHHEGRLLDLYAGLTARSSTGRSRLGAATRRLVGLVRRSSGSGASTPVTPSAGGAGAPEPVLSRAVPAARDDITNESEVGLPPLQGSRKAVWDYYRIEFLPSGYPGRRTGDQLYAHPIYGPYVISDYIAQYRTTRDEDYLHAAMRVADAAIGQMTAVGDGLAFVYDQDSTKVSRKQGSWYSGLTQARYLDVLSTLTRLPGTERFAEAVSAVLSSLELPVASGGVAGSTDHGGLIIEEYPSPAPDCTLNGWTTATAILLDYAASHSDDRAWELSRRSVRGLEDLLPLYDMAEYATSRYRLKGRAEMRLRSLGPELTVTDVKIRMPGAATVDANVAADPGGAALAGKPRRIRADESRAFKVELSRRTFPAPNTVVFTVDSSGDGEVQAAIGDGPFDPVTNFIVADRENDLGTFAVAAGRNVLEVAVPWTDAELVAYPTSFTKRIAGRQFNQYHWIHVDTLTRIVDRVDSDLLRYYRDRWRQMPDRWPSIAEYQDDRITLERFDSEQHR